MGAKMKVGAAALLMSVISIEQAFAGFFRVTRAVPEIDGSSGIAAIALLASIGAIFFGRSKNN